MLRKVALLALLVAVAPVTQATHNPPSEQSYHVEVELLYMEGVRHAVPYRNAFVNPGPAFPQFDFSDPMDPSVTPGSIDGIAYTGTATVTHPDGTPAEGVWVQVQHRFPYAAPCPGGIAVPNHPAWGIWNNACHNALDNAWQQQSPVAVGYSDEDGEFDFTVHTPQARWPGKHEIHATGRDLGSADAVSVAFPFTYCTYVNIVLPPSEACTAGSHLSGLNPLP